MKIYKGFTLLEAIIVITLIFIIASSTVFIFKDSDSSSDIEARSTIANVKKILDKKKGLHTIESLNQLNLNYDFISADSVDYNDVSIFIDNQIIYIAVSNNNGGCWLLQKNYKASSENLAEIYGYKENSPCLFSLASTLVREGDIGSIKKPIIL